LQDKKPGSLTTLASVDKRGASRAYPTTGTTITTTCQWQPPPPDDLHPTHDDSARKCGQIKKFIFNFK